MFFHLYGVFDPTNRAQNRDDVTYIYSTFPIVERQETDAHGHYLSLRETTRMRKFVAERRFISNG